MNAENSHPENRSLGRSNQSISVPGQGSFLKKLFAFSGPAYLIAVGYMDPGNWATDIAGGSRFGYSLLCVILIASLFAVLLQYLSIKLGIASGRDLAQASREYFSKPVNFFLWLMAEIMIIACDLAEVIGSAIALNLLFHLPLILGVVITSADVLLLLLLQNKGFRYLEALVISLITIIVISFGAEIFLSQPSLSGVLGGFTPAAQIFNHREILYLSIAILGATVMPHNLYLHSAVVQTRKFEKTPAGKKEAIKFSGIDSAIALFFAFLVNAAILIVSAAAFHFRGFNNIADIFEAHRLLAPLLGSSLAGILFAVALLASGQNSTITGTLAGQVIMEGFLNIKLKPWLRRLITRGLAIIPASIIVIFYGNSGLGKLLIFSQVVLSIQLIFAVFPLIIFTSNKKTMGEFANSSLIKFTAFSVAIIITILDGWLIYTSLIG